MCNIRISANMVKLHNKCGKVIWLVCINRRIINKSACFYTFYAWMKWKMQLNEKRNYSRGTIIFRIKREEGAYAKSTIDLQFLRDRL